jgi:hypothetical protein
MNRHGIACKSIVEQIISTRWARDTLTYVCERSCELAVSQVESAEYFQKVQQIHMPQIHIRNLDRLISTVRDLCLASSIQIPRERVTFIIRFRQPH